MFYPIDVTCGVTQGSVLSQSYSWFMWNNLSRYLMALLSAIPLTCKDPLELVDSINAHLNHIATQIKNRNLRNDINKTQFMVIHGKASRCKTNCCVIPWPHPTVTTAPPHATIATVLSLKDWDSAQWKSHHEHQVPSLRAQLSCTILHQYYLHNISSFSASSIALVSKLAS